MEFAARVHRSVQTTSSVVDVQSQPFDKRSGTPSSYGLSDAGTTRQASDATCGIDALLEAADILERRDKELPSPPVWPEGQRDIPPIAYDSSGMPYVPESDPYRGINWLIQAAVSLGDLPVASVAQVSAGAEKPRSRKRKRFHDEEHQISTPVAAKAPARKKAARSEKSSVSVGPAWGNVPIFPSKPEVLPIGRKHEDPVERRNSRTSDYQPSEASVVSTASESMLQNTKSETKKLSKTRRKAHATTPSSGSSSTSHPTKKAKGSTKSTSREWSQEEKAKLADLRSPFRPQGPVKHKDIAEILGRPTDLACRLECNKMRKAGEWPWSRADEREGKERESADRKAAKVDGRRRGGRTTGVSGQSME